jgi:iron complex outermembrane recepter protein
MDLPDKLKNHGSARVPISLCRIRKASTSWLFLGLCAGGALAQEASFQFTPGTLKKMTLEELMEIEITLVSRKPEKLTEAASAVQVITREDIRRSGAATLADALRLASNLQVAQLNAGTFAISSRGFNSTSNTLPNKLLVMIDGRTVYTPLYAGVFWEVQQVILEDVDRIEVVSGPGGSVWGANAVNGVINIVTLPAAETQGAFVEAGGGTFMRNTAAARFGGRAGRDIAWRVYGQRLDHNGSVLANGEETVDEWNLTRGGFRMDWALSEGDQVTVQSELVGASTDQAIPSPDDVDFNGQFLQARWNRAFTETADLVVKAYFDRTWRDIPRTLIEELRTFDLDAYHNFSPIRGNQLLWGAGYRNQLDDVQNPVPVLTSIQILPARKELQLFSAFLQDQQDVLDGRLRLTLGTRVEHNDYTGWEVMPSVRAAWSVTPRHTLWTAFSRAVRSPGRIDVEALTPPPDLVTDSTFALEGGPDFGSEKLHAYELGYRTGIADLASVSVAAFVHSYEELRILEMVRPLRFQFTNGFRGEVYGVELSGDLQAAPWWRIRGGYTYMRKDLYAIPGHMEFPQPGNQGNDPAWQAMLHSFLDLPRGFELNGSVRFMDDLPSPSVPAYFTFDLGLGWRWKLLEISVYGRNLAQDRHQEARVGDALPAQEVPRSVTGKLALRF